MYGNKLENGNEARGLLQLCRMKINSKTFAIPIQAAI